MSMRTRLIPGELELWKEFTPIAKGKYHSFIFDVQVKPTREILDLTEKEYLKNWDSLTSPRIDVYGLDEKGTSTIFEIRERADFSTLASVIAYAELMKTTGQIKGTFNLVIICREITKNTENLANMKGIRIYQLKRFPGTPSVNNAQAQEVPQVPGDLNQEI